MAEEKPGPKLSEEQRSVLLTWIAADYEASLILKWFRARKWPHITRQTVSYYRGKFADEIDELRKARHHDALATGLALKEERVARLKQHADDLEAIKWVPDPKTGKLHNEKVWRETLDDIAKEVGGRAIRNEHSGPDGRPIVIQKASDLSDDDLAAIIARSGGAGTTKAATGQE